MHFSEDDLRSALRRKDPGERFAFQVMARIRKDAAAEPARRRLWRSPGLVFHKLVLAGVLLAVVSVATWEGLGQYRRAEQRRAGEVAGRQAVLALRLATAKLNYIFASVQAAGRDQTSSGGRNEEN